LRGSLYYRLIVTILNLNVKEKDMLSFPFFVSMLTILFVGFAWLLEVVQDYEDTKRIQKWIDEEETNSLIILAKFRMKTHLDTWKVNTSVDTWKNDIELPFPEIGPEDVPEPYSLNDKWYDEDIT